MGFETVEKPLFFDRATASCLQPFWLPGGKKHKETPTLGRSVDPAKPDQPEKRKGSRPLNNPIMNFFDRLKSRNSGSVL